MAKQGFPASGVRFGKHPDAAGFPASGARYGAHPDGSSGPAPVTATDPLAIVGGTPFFYLIADLGVTAGPPLTWTDQSVAGNSGTGGAGATSPAYTASDAALNNRGYITADGTDDLVVLSTWDPPAPGTTNIWFWFVFRQVSWTNNDDLYSANSATALRLTQSTASPQMVATNGVVGTLNGGVAVGNWARGEHLFSNSVGDYLKIGSTSVTGVNTGNTDAALGAFRLFCRSGVGFGNYSLAVIGAWAGDPGSTAKAQLDTWVTSYYGASVAV